MKIVCLGDSFTFGLGVKSFSKWVHLIGKELEITTVCKGVSGDTTGGMLARFEKDVLREKPDKVLLIGGGNDFIMGSDLTVVKTNMMALVHQARAAAIEPIIATQVPAVTDMVPDYWKMITDFEAVNGKYFEQCAWYEMFSKAFNVPFINLFMEFACATNDDPESYYLEGVHLNEKGHRLIADILKNHRDVLEQPQKGFMQG